MSGLRFLHLADVHLGLRVTRFSEEVCRRLREARFQALDRAVRWAEEQRVDFILIAGDLFDDNTVSRTDAQRAYDLLKGRSMQVYVLPGNHDPYCAGSLWQRGPWNDTEGTSIHLLTTPEPVAVSDAAVLLPCPVTGRRSEQDPTGWITPDGADRRIRIGVAHGSVMDRANLPHDDHPLPPDAPAQRGLDYLALGHWHTYKPYIATDGAPRMAYAGTTEQMSFDGTAQEVGWQAYASAPDRLEFCGGAPGAGLSVGIGAPQAVPVLEQVSVGQCSWLHETEEVSDERFESIFTRVAQRPDPGRHLLRLTLTGFLSLDKWTQLESFEAMLDRYLHYELDVDPLRVRPEAGKMEEVLGAGLLRDVWQRLQERAQQQPEAQQVLDRAKLLLYQLAQEAQR